ncbi:MAG: murein L,D-transpeptidase [Parvibaculaceae bacterium]
MRKRILRRTLEATLLAGVVVLPPLWAAAAHADNAGDPTDRRRGNWSSRFDPSSQWFRPDNRRAQPRRQVQPPFGWWWQEEQTSGWGDGNRPNMQATDRYDPEPEVVQGAPIYDYKPDPLVALGDKNLKWTDQTAVSLEQGDSLVSKERVTAALPRDPMAWKIFEELRDQTSSVRVTEAQRKAVVAFYAQRNFKPLWSTDGAATERSRAVLALMAKAGEEGLDSSDYLPPVMSGFSDDPASVAGGEQGLAQFDLGLTASTLRYAMQASGGRIVPNRLSGYHDLKPPTVAPADALQHLAEDEKPETYLAGLNPTLPAYAALKQELAKLEQGEAVVTFQPIAMGATLRPGELDERIPDIRARLLQLGQLTSLAPEPVSVAPVGNEAEQGEPLFGSAQLDGAIEAEPAIAGDGSLLYDETLEAAVRSFQGSMGLRPDGLIGSRTIAALNGDSGKQIRRRERIILSMERLRWLPRSLGARHVFVNQAAFTASVIENGHPVWTTKVIVGKPNTQTAVFSDEIETVEFNPYWGVPGSIILHEMLPRLKNDPSYLDREGYEVVNSRGAVVSSSSVDWWSVSKANIPIGVRQPPGSQNALGEVKFLFPNSHAIYMHDTPTKPLFSKDMRAFSHGCVRVENPRHFAELLLGWDQEQIAAEISTGRNHPVKLDRKVPVHLAYFTAWPDSNGTIHYYDDVYSRDDQLERALGTSRVAMR